MQRVKFLKATPVSNDGINLVDHEVGDVAEIKNDIAKGLIEAEHCEGTKSPIGTAADRAARKAAKEAKDKGAAPANKAKGNAPKNKAK